MKILKMLLYLIMFVSTQEIVYLKILIDAMQMLTWCLMLIMYIIIKHYEMC